MNFTYILAYSVSYVIEFAIGLLRKGLGSLQYHNDITQVLAKIIAKTQTMWWHSKPHVAKLSCTYSLKFSLSTN